MGKAWWHCRPHCEKEIAASAASQSKANKVERRSRTHYLRSYVCSGCGGREPPFLCSASSPPPHPCTTKICQTHQPKHGGTVVPIVKKRLLLQLHHRATPISACISSYKYVKAIVHVKWIGLCHASA